MIFLSENGFFSTLTFQDGCRERSQNPDEGRGYNDRNVKCIKTKMSNLVVKAKHFNMLIHNYLVFTVSLRARKPNLKEVLQVDIA